MSRQRAYQHKHAAAGLCIRCSAPATHGLLCARHHTRRAVGYRAQRLAAGYPPPRRYTCGRCGARGHTRRICRPPIRAPGLFVA